MIIILIIVLIVTRKWTERIDIMREILFRGKRIDNSQLVYGSLDCRPDGKFYIICYKNIDNGIIRTNEYRVKPDSVGQYTGLTDKNGKKIFEGDILAIKFYPRYSMRVSWDGKPDAVAKVFWDFSAFRLRAKNDVDIRYADFCDICFQETGIIGNIHDNPELLEGE